MKLFHLPLQNTLRPLPGYWCHLTACVLFLLYAPVHAAEGLETSESQNSLENQARSENTKTIVAELLMIDGNFYIVRGERGEIQIEITPETQLSETFEFGDRIKAVVLPNDKALSITRAQPGEPSGVFSEAAGSTPTPPESSSSASPAPEAATTEKSVSVPSDPEGTNVRVVIADLLMIDRELYIVRTEQGEIQIEVTPDTELAENFQFGDRIKARITKDDKALSIVRANPAESPGIQLEKSPSQKTPPRATAPAEEGGFQEEESSSASSSDPSEDVRTIVAEILMIDGDFYVVRGERGEIRIEVTPNTTLSENFKFGDRIKAKVLPDDTALSIERAQSE